MCLVREEKTTTKGLIKNYEKHAFPYFEEANNTAWVLLSQATI
jgi:Leu/Phe-tRNA-protein transferase